MSFDAATISASSSDVFAGDGEGGGSDMLLGGRILLVCAVSSPKMGTATKKNRGLSADGWSTRHIKFESSSSLPSIK